MPLTNVLSIRLRPERILRYQELLRAVAKQAVRKHDASGYQTHQNAIGELGWIHFISQDEDWAGLAARGTPEGIIYRVLGAREGRRWQEQALECTLEARHEVVTDRPDLSYPPDRPGDVAPAAVVTRLRVRPGGQDACEELIRKLAEAIPKVGDPARLLSYQVVLGRLGEYWTVRPLEAGLGELDRHLAPQELLHQAFGPSEGGLVFRSGLAAIEAVQRDVVVYRPDLSNPGAD